MKTFLLFIFLLAFSSTTAHTQPSCSDYLDEIEGRIQTGEYDTYINTLRQLDSLAAVCGGKKNEQPPATIGRIHLYQAKVYRHLYDFVSSKQHLQSAIESLEESHNYRLIGEAYYEMAKVLHQVKDFYRGIDYIDLCYKAYQRVEKSEEMALDITKAQFHQGKLCLGLGIYSLAKTHFQRASVGFDTLGLHIDKARVMSQLGSLSLDEQYGAVALFYYRNAMGAEVDLRASDPEILSQIYLGMGKSHQSRRTLDSAAYFFRQSEQLLLEQKVTHHKSFVTTYRCWGNYWKEKNDLSQALKFYQKGMRYALPDFHPQSLEDLPTIHDQTLITGDYEHLFTLLQSQAEAWNLNKPNSARHTTSDSLAVQYYVLADKLLQRMQKEQLGCRLQEFWITQMKALYEPAISISQTNGYIDEMLYFMERGRVGHLIARMRARDAAQTGELAKVIEKENQYKIQLYTAENQLSEYGYQRKTDAEDLKKLKQAAQDTRTAFHTYLTQLQASQPPYAGLLYSDRVVTIKEIQSYLAQTEGEGLWLQMYQGEEDLFILFITQNSLETVKIQGYRKYMEPNQRGLLGHLKIRKSGRQKDKLAAFKSHSYKAYQILLSHFLDDHPDTISHLIIIPDGIWSRIPFEALITEEEPEGTYADLPYLIRRYSIQYGYSAADFIRVQPTSRRASGILAVAPIKFPYLPPKMNLPQTEEEVDIILADWAGSALKREGANLLNVQKKMAGHQVLHFATHASGYDNDQLSLPHIVLRDEVLTIEDVYTLHTQADMLVLSHCDALEGEYAQGEGVEGIARAFQYIGAPSLVTSLWPVEDKRSRELIQSFYQHLGEGMTKDQAMRQAKLAFLKDAQGLDAHPYAWAHMIVAGDHSPLMLSPAFPYIYLFVAVGVMGLLGIFFWIRRRVGKG